MMDPFEEETALLESPAVKRAIPSNSRRNILIVMGLVSVFLTIGITIPLVTRSKNSGFPGNEPELAVQNQLHQEPVEERVKSLYSSIFHTNVNPTYHTPPNYIVNLDLPPEQRWIQVAKDYKYIMPQLSKEILQVSVPKVLIPLVEKVAGVLENTLNKEYVAELRGIADAAEMEIGALIIGNVLYDFTAHCTSIVAQDSAGQIWHARNFDYEFTQTLKDLSIDVSFQRDGNTIYKATTFPGYVGIITGQKENKFTISANQRNPGTPLWKNWLTALLDGKEQLMAFAIREAFEKSENFAHTVEILSVVDTAAPVYYIIAGVNADEGVIISKGRLEAVDLWFLDNENGRWYLVETNYDHWQPPPYNDNRRDPANQALNRTGQDGISTEALFDILYLPSVRQESTVYTTVMSAAQPEIYTTHVMERNNK